MARVKLFLFSVTLMSFLRCITSDYVAAVVEYQSVVLPSPNDTVKANLEQYVFNIEQAKTSGAQIIVFPEYGLTGDIQNVSLYGIEIPNTGAGTNFTDEWLQKLSNAAVAHSIYIVVNLVEKSTNNANKTIYYNTDVVFDKNGKIAAKYRKINLFDEPNVTAGNANENQVTFTTDFGITFGIFTCYDLANPNPGRTILANSNVTDIVYPTAWSSFLPFYHSLSMQHGYAVANGVNLLAANLNKPEVGVGGSGIYNADGSVSNYYISGSPGTRLIIGNVKNTPVQRGLGGTLRGIDNLDNNDSDVQSPILNFNASRLFTADKYVFKTLNISQSNITEEVCQNSFCCKFTIAVNSTQVNSTDIYKIMAFNGAVQVLSTQRKNQRICSLLACETDDIYTCGKHTVKLSSKFASIVVETSAAADKPVYYQPFSLTTNLVPVFNTTFNATVDNGVKKYSFYNQLEQENVVGFGFTGSDSSASVTGFSAFLLIGALFLNYAFF